MGGLRRKYGFYGGYAHMTKHKTSVQEEGRGQLRFLSCKDMTKRLN